MAAEQHPTLIDELLRWVWVGVAGLIGWVWHMVHRHESRLTRLEAQQDAVHERFDEIGKRFDRVESLISDELRELRRDLNGGRGK